MTISRYLYVLAILSTATAANASSCENRSRFTLSLQPIQSNFIAPATPLAGNNGYPIPGGASLAGPNIPVEVVIDASKHGERISLHVEGFSFSLTATGFLIAQTFLPKKFSPTSAQWLTFSAGDGLEGHLFRDGSIRFSGIENSPLVPGVYTVEDSAIHFYADLFPNCARGFALDRERNILVRTDNFPISQGQSNVTGNFNSLNNANFDYGEYFGLQMYNGDVLTVSTDNSFDNMQFPIAVFNRVNSRGNHLISQVDVVPQGYANDPSMAFGLGEISMSINPVNPNQIAATVVVDHVPNLTLGLEALAISNDAGLTWTIVDPLASSVPLPAPIPGFPYPILGGDQQTVYDAFGNLFYVNLGLVTNSSFTEFTTVGWVTLSTDNGITWTLIDTVTGINPETFGLDYPILATGVEPDGSSVTWLMLKQDVSFDEILGVGASLPLMTAAYKTTALGVVADKKYQEVPGSNVGGYGNICVGPDGSVLITGQAMNNSLGSLPFTNSVLWYSFNPGGFNGLFEPIKIVANSNAESYVFFSYYLPQQQRGTAAHLKCAIDKNGRWYFVYLDQETTHAVQPNPNLYLIYSDDQGVNWSTPMQINNDTNQKTFHIMPEISVDPFTNDLAIAWIDSREDQDDTATRVWATVIKNKSLPFIG